MHWNIHQLFARLRHAAFWLAVAITTAGYGFLLPALMLPRHWLLAIVRTYLAIILFLFRGILGVSWHADGDAGAASGPVLVAAKHQSGFETLILQYVLKDPVIVLKRELLQVPLFGWVLRRLGHIGVNREDGLEAARALRAAALEAHAQRRPVVIFPEGSRRAPGDAPSYKSGVDLLYVMLKSPCIPVAVNSGRIWPPGARLPQAGHITIAFLPAIPPKLPRSAFVVQLKTAIEEASELLLRTPH